MFLGKLMIASATVACFYALITFYTTAAEAIQEPIAMLIVIFSFILDRRIDSIRRLNGLYVHLQSCHGYSFGLFHRR